MSDALSNALKQMDEAASIAAIDQDIVKILKKPKRTLQVHIPVKMDDGRIEIFAGYRVQHNDALGPVKGGTRFHPEVTLRDVEALALWMTIKNSLARIPGGGGKGGIICDPAKLSMGELERLCRGYIRAIIPLLGQQNDIPGADIGTTGITMSWMLDEFEVLRQTHQPGAISGKFEVLGGSAARPEATGRGVMVTVQETLNLQGESLAGATVAIQGFGKVGYHAARLMHQLGAKIVAVGDLGGAIYNADGIDPEQLHDHLLDTGSVANFQGASPLELDQLLLLKCDVLLLAAVQNVITEDNAPLLNCKIVAEGANGPTTPEAEKILLAKGIMVIPDILANAGGTVVAHLERSQNMYDLYWDSQQVNEQMEKIMRSSFHATVNKAKEKAISWRLASWVQALERLASAMKARGTV